MAGWIKMPLGMEVGLSLGDFVSGSAVTIFLNDIKIAILDQNRNKSNNRFCLLKVTIFMNVKKFV